MSQQGRGAKATAAQRAEVKRLSAAGGSVPGIAAEVFGDERFRSRVERILRPGREPIPRAALGRPARSPEEVEACLREFASLGQTAQLRWLYELQLEVFVARETPASARELRMMLDVLRQVEAREELERVKACSGGARRS